MNRVEGKDQIQKCGVTSKDDVMQAQWEGVGGKRGEGHVRGCHKGVGLFLIIHIETLACFALISKQNMYLWY